MSDSKINMALDDIIRMERRTGANNRRSGLKNVSALRRGVGNRRGRFAVRGGRLRANPGRAVASTVNATARSVASIMNNPVTRRLVNRLVKNAINQRANRSLLNRAANRRTARAVRSRPAFTRALPTVGGIGRGRGAGRRLYALNQRSQVIMKRQAPPIQRLAIGRSVPVRGRGIVRMGRLASDMEEVSARRQPRVAREVAPEVSQRNAAVVRRGVLVRAAPAQRGMRYLRPVRQSVIRKRGFVQRRGSANNRRFRPVVAQQQFLNASRMQKNARMREALGIGHNRRFDSTRFEPASDFLQRLPTANRRGRSFQRMYEMR